MGEILGELGGLPDSVKAKVVGCGDDGLRGRRATAGVSLTRAAGWRVAAWKRNVGVEPVGKPLNARVVARASGCGSRAVFGAHGSCAGQKRVDRGEWNEPARADSH
jgi:hypothetical protein